MKYYLGIDGGGTKTTAILCDENAHLISRFVGESINYNSVGMETARENLRQTVDGVLAENDIKLNAAFIGMSAISDRADDNFTRKFCAGIIDCDKVTMDSDVYIGLEAMRCDGAAAMVISGTGSMAVGRLPDGKIIHTGGWGYILGDEGSGYSMSVDALRAAICGYEGSAEKTSLTKAVLDYYKIDDINGLIDIFYDPPMPRSEIAKLTHLLFYCAENDGVADAIIRNHARLLANTVSALLSQMPESTPLGLWGGIFQNCEKFRKHFSENINEKFPSTKINVLEYAPEYGAVFAAIKTDGE